MRSSLLRFLGRLTQRPIAELKEMRGRGLRTELVVLIVFAVIPLLVLSLGVMLWGAWLQQRSLENGLENTTSALSLAVSRELESWRAGLRVIARSAELERGDFAALQQRVSPIAAAMGGWIVLFDPDGRQLMNTIVPHGTPLKDAANRREIFRVVATQESTASDLFRGADAGREIIVVYEPVLQGGTVKYVLGLGMDPDRLSRLLAVQPLPTGWYSILFDGSNRVIARSAAAGDFLGRMAPAWFVGRGSERGILRGTGMTGSEILAAYQNLRDAPWTVSVAVPRVLVARERNVAIALLGIGALVLLVIALWMSGRVAARIAAPVRALARAAEEGKLPTAASSSGLRELQELERALIRASDVERERASERERRLALEAANKAKDEFLATLSHELRTPLQAALGWLHVLRMSVEDAEARNRAVPVIERNLRQLGQLVDDLIDASRIVSGKVALKIEPQELSGLVRQTAETWLPAVAAKGQTLKVQAVDGVWAQVDRARLAQVLTNLIANSVKFTPRGGRIDVRLRASPGEAELTVADNGDGIAPEALPNIFNKFWQVQSGSERRYQGLGLGLAIVKSLVELQGGRVSAASDGLGHGSTFTVTLPRMPAPADAVAPATHDTLTRAEDGRELSDIRVLLVDDDVDAGGAIAQLLSLEGAAVTFVNSVKEAVRMLGQQDFDVAVSDIAMPEQDGFDFLRAARRHRPHLPVLALTAFASDRDRQRVLAAGFSGFLSKPIDAIKLYDTVRVAAARGARPQPERA
jgi:signal transduction histidine kinase/ActR/RegA family two-component response regulator